MFLLRVMLMLPMRILSGIQPGRAAPRELFRHDEAGPRVAGAGRGVLFYRRLSRVDLGATRPSGARNTLDVALDFLACGLDPKKTVFFRQSDVPEVTELTWLLGDRHADGPAGTLPRYKDKLAKGLTSNHGLFAYPVLMAADILIYESNVVPVGPGPEAARGGHARHRHQVQRAYGETFVMPEPQIRPDVATVPARRAEDEQELRQHHRSPPPSTGSARPRDRGGSGVVPPPGGSPRAGRPRRRRGRPPSGPPPG